MKNKTMLLKSIIAISLFSGSNYMISAEVKVKNKSLKKVIIANPQGKTGPIEAVPGQEVTLTDEQYNSAQVQSMLKNGSLRETENPQKQLENKTKMDEMRKKIKRIP